MLVSSIFSFFQQCFQKWLFFFKVIKTRECQPFLLFSQFFQKASFLGSLKVGIVWQKVNSLPQIPTFNDPEKRRLLKTLWEKKKMLVTSIFSISTYVFYPSKKEFQFQITIILLSANFFQF